MGVPPFFPIYPLNLGNTEDLRAQRAIHLGHHGEGGGLVTMEKSLGHHGALVTMEKSHLPTRNTCRCTQVNIVLR